MLYSVQDSIILVHYTYSISSYSLQATIHADRLHQIFIPQDAIAKKSKLNALTTNLAYIVLKWKVSRDGGWDEAIE
jgi:hypothetical protein